MINVDERQMTLTLTNIAAKHPRFSRGQWAIRDWSDQAQVHRSIMGLFDKELPGPDRERRSRSSILYRAEMSASQPRVLIQHAVPLSEVAEGIESVRLDRLISSLEAGQPVRFRNVLNAVRTQSRTGRRVPILPSIEGSSSDSLLEFLTAKLEPAIVDIRLHETNIEVCRVDTVPLHMVSYDGFGTVGDTDLLRSLIRDGVGRARAYGCGLLSILPLRT